MPKIYAFRCGILKTQTQYMLKDTRVGTPLNIPVPFFLIQHGNDWIAFDTGVNVKAIENPVAHMGEDKAKAFTPEMEPKDEFMVQIKKLGLQPKDIKALILSHAHFDHAGSVGNFRGTNVPIIIQKKEFAEIKKMVDAGKSGAYLIGDFEGFRELNFKEIDGIYDVFCDKSVVVFPTPGHTIGHQSLYVKTSEGNPFVLPADALYTSESMEKMIPSNSAADFSLLMQNISMFKIMNMMGVEVVPSHDPNYWANMSLAPEEFKKLNDPFSGSVYLLRGSRP